MSETLDLGKYLQRVREKEPQVHCITNFVTAGECANIILACGGRPVMAHHIKEAEEITQGSDALVLNMGTVNDVEAMLLAGRRSNELGHPVILDPVGVSGSGFRRETFARLTQEIRFQAIRGNVSEIRYIATGHSRAAGVDACPTERITEENVGETAATAQAVSRRLGCVVAVSGSLDVVADSQRALILRGGHPLMARVTGTGCMSAALLGAFLGAAAARRPQETDGRLLETGDFAQGQGSLFEAAAAAAAMMKVCGSLAYEKTAAEGGGTMTFRMHLIDAVSLLTSQHLNLLAKVSRQPGEGAGREEGENE